VARLINFAHGSVYMAGAYLGWLMLTVVHAPLWAALPAAVAGSALIGLLVERFAVRPFGNSARVAPLLATLGAGMILDGAAERLFSPNPQPFPAAVPADRFLLGSVSLGWLDILIAGATVASAVGLYLFLRLTKAGQALRATAQDPEAAQQMGVPVQRVRSLAFAVASALGGLAGALVGLYYNSVSPSVGFQAGLKGFTACILGGLGSVPGAMAGGLVLGVFESFGVAAFGSSARGLVSFGLLLAALVWRPNGLFARGTLRPPEPLAGTFLPAAPAFRVPWPAAVSLAVAAALFPLFVSNGYLLQILTNGWIMALFAVSLTLLAGTTGILSLGHAGLMAIGAYTSGLLTVKLGWPFEAAFLMAGLVAASLGTLLASPALRLKGHYLSIATLALGEIVNQVIVNADPLTGGAVGLPGIPPPSVAGLAIDSTPKYYWLTLGALVVGAGLVAWLIRSKPGRTLRAIREDETAAEALGVRPTPYRALAFVVAGFFAGWAGALSAHLYSYINHETFNAPLSILGLTMVIAGGLGNVGGAVLGGVALSTLPEILRPVAEYRPIVYGLLLLVLLRWRPQGALGSL
jgi:branched-chain amino acid transport system permease protein